MDQNHFFVDSSRFLWFLKEVENLEPFTFNWHLCKIVPHLKPEKTTNLFLFSKVALAA